MKYSVWPRTLSRQLVLILFSGVTLALVSSAGIHLHDRRQALFAFGEIQTAQRFATIVQLLDPISGSERKKIALAVETPLQYLRFLENEHPITENDPSGSEESHIRALLRSYLGAERPLRVAVIRIGDSDDVVAMAGQTEAFGGMPVGMGIRMVHHHRGHMETMNRILPQGVSFLAQVQLSDGIWAEFHNHLPKEAFTWSKHLIYYLILLLFVVTFLSFVAVRLTTHPLSLLASAAQALGQDIHHPPLAINGPGEVQYAARAFNTMQARIIRHIQERTHLLAAISHDLKTPLTRMRLQTEKLQNESAQKELLESLSEMEGMTMAAMAYIQGMEGMEEVKLLDIPSMLEKLQEEFQEMGREVTVLCGDLPAFPVMQKSLKRCLVNLVSNAVFYGKRAHVRADVLAQRLQITIVDEGPGIPEEDREKVLHPFVRLETSRNRNTGGTGLGLSIAHNIVRAHGGELTLQNRREGGLEVVLTLPSSPTNRSRSNQASGVPSPRWTDPSLREWG